MALMTANLTELDAVNDMLLSIGEAPVNSLATGLADAALAQSILTRTSRKVQLEGWTANTRRGIELSRDANNFISVPVNTLRVDTTSRRPNRKEVQPALSGHINVSVRKSSDDTQFLLYDNDNDRETWPNDATLTVDIIQMLAFDDLPPSLQAYISALAGRRFQQTVMASQVLNAFTENDVIEALEMALQDDADTDDDNMTRDNSHVFAVTYRNNSLFGR